MHALALVHDVLEESAGEAAVFRGRIRDGLGAPLLADRVANLASAPPQWGSERCLAYAAHSQQLLALLHGTHGGLEARLSERLQSAPWCLGKSV